MTTREGPQEPGPQERLPEAPAPLLPPAATAAQRELRDRLAAPEPDRDPDPGTDGGRTVVVDAGPDPWPLLAPVLAALLGEGRRVTVVTDRVDAARAALPPALRAVEHRHEISRPETPHPDTPHPDTPHPDTPQPDPQEARRAELLAERAELVDTLVHAAGAEAEVHPEVAPGFAGTATDIATAVAATRAEDGWTLALGATAGPPVELEEFAELRALLAGEAADPGRARRRRQVLPPPAELPPESHLADLAHAVGATSPPPGRGAVVAALCSLPTEPARHLAPVSERVAESLDELDAGGPDARWARGVADGVLSGRAAGAWTRAVATLPAVDRAVEQHRRAGPVEVRASTLLDPVAAAEALDRLAEHLAGGGTLRRVFRTEEQRAAEEVLEGLDVRGTDPRTSAGARAVAAHLRVVAAHAELVDGFGPLGLVLAPPAPREVFLGQVLGLRATCRRIGGVLTTAAQLRALLEALPPERRPRLDGLVGLDAVSTVALDVAESTEGDLARRELGDVLERVQGGAPPARQAPEMRLVVDALRRLDVAGYAVALEAVDAARAQQREVRRTDELAAQLGASAPGMLAALRADPRAATWAAREARWSSGWAHARAARWLARRADDGTAASAASRLASVDRELTELTERLVATRAAAHDAPPVQLLTPAEADAGPGGADVLVVDDREAGRAEAGRAEATVRVLVATPQDPADPAAVALLEPLGEPTPWVRRVRDDLAARGVVVEAPARVASRAVDLVARAPGGSGEGRVVVVCDDAGPLPEAVRRARVEDEQALRALGERVVRVRASDYALSASSALAPVLGALAPSPYLSPRKRSA